MNLKQTLCNLVLSAATVLSGCAAPVQHLNSAERYETRVLELSKNDLLNFYQTKIEEQANYDKEYSSEVREELEEIIENMDLEEFRAYDKLTSNLYSNHFIINPQRYSMKVLEALNKRPLEDLEKPTILFIMGKYDHSLPFRIHPLEEKTDKIKDLLDRYRVVLYEVSGKEELRKAMIEFSINELFRNGEAIVKGKMKGKVAGLVFGAHGSRYSLITDIQEITFEGKTREDEIIIHWDQLIRILSPYEKLFDKDAIVLFASCNAGEGRDRELNLANVAAYSLPGRKVYSCDRKLLDFDFEKKEDGNINPESLKLYSISRHLESSDCTYVAQCNNEKECLKEFLEKSGKSNLKGMNDLLNIGIELPIAFIDRISNYPNPYQIVKNFAVRGITTFSEMEKYLETIDQYQSKEGMQKQFEIMMRSLNLGYFDRNCVDNIVNSFRYQINPDPRKFTREDVTRMFNEYEGICDKD
ncbi:MAG: hypothetical protein Q8Q01_05290 [archaeon]|nr:hypothetical protein [archaeon]